MGDAAQKKATYADLEGLPPNVVGEIFFGVLHAFPRPRSRHRRASSRLGARLGPPFDEGEGGPGGWILLDEPPIGFVRCSLRRRGRTTSPTSARSTIASASRICGCDPDAMTLEVQRWAEGGYVTVASWRTDAVVRAEPFEAVELPLATLWAR